MRSIVAAFVLSCLTAAGAVRAAPLEAYGKLPSIEEVALSPNGSALAFIVTNGEDRNIAVKDIASGKVTFQALTGHIKVRGIMWAGDKHLLVITSATAMPFDISGPKREWSMVQSIDLATGKAHALMGDVKLAMNTIFDTPIVREVAGQPAVFVEGVSFAQGNQGHLAIFRIDIDHSYSSLAEIGSENTRDWVIGPDGQVVAQEIYDAKSGHWSVRVKAGAGWRVVQSGLALQDPPYLIGLGRQGNSVIFASKGDDRRWAWREIRLDGTPDPDPAVALEDQGPIHDPRTGELIGSRAIAGDERRYNFFDARDAQVWKLVLKAFPGEAVRLVSMSSDRRRIVVQVDSPTLGPAYSLIDFGAHTANWIGPEYGGLDDGDIALKRAIRFKARDGLDLSGYLTVPRGKRETALPLVVLAHGGPAARDMPDFDWWSQALASRGYAVLQVNFRGSAGLGATLLEAGYGQWGRKMQTDLSDGVADLAKKGVIDPKRVCIVGGSYGGYAALAGATLDPGVYRCAVSVAGVADLRRQVLFSKEHGGVGVERYWTRFMGAEDPADPVLAKYSPAKLAENANIPVLLIHGQDDTVVPISQSLTMASALQHAGKTVDLVVLKSDDHWLSRGATRLQMLQATVAFLEKNNPPN